MGFALGYLAQGRPAYGFRGGRLAWRGRHGDGLEVVETPGWPARALGKPFDPACFRQEHP